MKKIFLITRTDHCDYDQFNGIVIIAKTPTEAKKYILKEYGSSFSEHTIVCELLGIAENSQEYGVILESYIKG